MIRIATGYADLLNLYGDYANIKALVRYLRDCGQLVETTGFSIGGYTNLKMCDLLYIGAGTERKMLQALGDFRRYFEELRIFCEEKGGFVFATGNAIALLGRTVTDSMGNVHEAAGLLDLDCKIDNKRRYSELLLHSELTERPVIGNVNSSMVVTSRETPAFTVIGEAGGYSLSTEGAVNGSVFATELSGPLLIRNPALLRRFSEIYADRKLPENEQEWLKTMEMGYDRALAALRKELKA